MKALSIPVHPSPQNAAETPSFIFLGEVKLRASPEESVLISPVGTRIPSPTTNLLALGR